MPDALPDRVYHYTSTAGLLGIISEGRIRATDLRYVNDTSELLYGVTETLMAWEQRAQGPTRKTSFVDKLASAYDIADRVDVGARGLSALASLPRPPFEMVAQAIVAGLADFVTIGVACFCARGDLLSQWRGYGSGGCALGFDADLLHQVVENRYLPLTKVVYGAPKTHHLRRLSMPADELIDADHSSVDPAQLRELTLPLLGLGAQLKHDAFESEQEFRLGDIVTDRPEAWKFRESPIGVVPYLDIDLRADGRMPLREIYLAPGPEVALRQTAVRALLRSSGYDERGAKAVAVKPSSVPFRG